MSSRKALFFDVDGTLLSEINRNVPESAVKAVEEARRLGHLTFINSGRVSKLLDPFRKMIDMDGYLCGCGTYIIVGDEELYARKIPHERGLAIKEDLKKYRVEGILEGKGGCHFRRETSWMPRIEQIRRSIASQGALSPYSIEEDNYDFDKFCCVTDADSDKEGFFGTLAEDFDVIDRGGNFWECVPKGHSKAIAIQMILDHYGLSLEDAYVFGDSTNDLPMFTYAKNAVLMGHHDKELEPYATFTTRTVEEDGIAYAMKALGIIDGVYYQE
ncbi:MAG: HAD family hydrolase [Lachnospiraceae bacterium]|nr:HAD family hydrolase [Lachnospiraceae bacterium]